MATDGPIRQAEVNSGFEYRHELWGEVICGTREQLRALGLDFGEPLQTANLRRPIPCLDPRGFHASIAAAGRSNPERLSVTIRFPCPDRPLLSTPKEYAEGVSLSEFSYCDFFRGTGKALCAAGLLRLQELPGAPGMSKTHVWIYPDGSTTSTRGQGRAEYPAGCRSIRRASEVVFHLWRYVPRDEQQHRRLKDAAALENWEREMRALPRPPALGETYPSGRQAGGAPPLRLVWSSAG
jgi:hypothetical protein